jgi:hypothetical protein
MSHCGPLKPCEPYTLIVSRHVCDSVCPGRVSGFELRTLQMREFVTLNLATFLSHFNMPISGQNFVTSVAIATINISMQKWLIERFKDDLFGACKNEISHY